MKQYDVNSSLVTDLPSLQKNIFHHVALIQCMRNAMNGYPDTLAVM